MRSTYPRNMYDIVLNQVHIYQVPQYMRFSRPNILHKFNVCYIGPHKSNTQVHRAVEMEQFCALQMIASCTNLALNRTVRKLGKLGSE